MTTMCDYCDEAAPATLYCYGCKFHLCEACAAVLHKRRAMHNHSVVPSKDYLFYNDKFIPTDTDFEEDIHNKFVVVNHEHQSISLGERFYTLDEIESHELTPVVSFVGPTGTGKSTIIRLFCKEECARPPSSDPQSITSTSADIHAYVGYIAKSNTPKILLLDSEGCNGTTPQSFKAICKDVAWEKLCTLLETRKNIVNSTFPRLLYLFSSVFCFVFTGSPKEQQTWANLISSYTSTAAAASVNQRTLPSIVVVFNKTTLAEGIWDIEVASTKFRECFAGYTTMLSELKVVYIPDRDADGARYSEQINAFKVLVAKCIDNHKLYTKKELFKMFSYALPTFTQDPKAVFNFANAITHNKPLPYNYTLFLVEFFTIVRNMTLEQKSTLLQAFEVATAALIKRLYDSFLHHLKRSNVIIAVRESVLEDLEKIVAEVEKEICEYLPCTATHIFPTVHIVECECVKSGHGKHQSSKTYAQQVPLPSYLLRLLGMTSTVTHCCRWEGAIQLPSKYAQSGWLAAEIKKEIPQASIETFAMQHKQVVKVQQGLLSCLKTTRVCLACLLQLPTEVLQCGHSICVPCCRELQNNGNIECPFCNKTGVWNHIDIPEGAGFRVLAITGTGTHGVVSAVILRQIEEQLRIPISDLFDLIIGCDFGGLTALGMGALRMTGEAMVQYFYEELHCAFKVLDVQSLLMCFWHRYIYNRAPLSIALEKIFKKKPLFGCLPFPRVMVASCEMVGGRAEHVFLSSHNSYSNDIFSKKIDVCTTLLQAAEITTSDRDYYPVINIPQIGSFASGRKFSHKLSTYSYEAGKDFWHSKNLDYLLSVGPDYSNITLLDNFILAKQEIEERQQPKDAWDRLHKKHHETLTKSQRIHPPISARENSSIHLLATTTTEYLNIHIEMLNNTCNNLLAKLFYLELPYDIANVTDPCCAPLHARVKVPQIAKVANLIDAFSVELLCDKKKNPYVTSKISCVNEDLQLELNNMPLAGTIEIDVLCHILYDGSTSEKGIPISGCPYMISRDAKLDQVPKLKKDQL